MAQTSYSNTIPIGFAGQLGDLDQAKYVRSHTNAEASAEMPFGIAVAQGSSDSACILLADADAKFIGVTIHSDVYSARDMGTTGVKPKNMMNVLTKGTCYVVVEESVSVGDVPYVRYTASGGNTQKGAFRKSDDTSKAMPLYGSRYLTSAAGGGIALVEIDANAWKGITAGIADIP